MTPAWVQVLLSSILLLSHQAEGQECPFGCKCSLMENGVSADCSGSAGEPSTIYSVPKGFPANTSSIYLAHNNITKLSKSSFRGLNNLTILSLYGNKIEKISSRTFSNLTSLSRLDLSFNNLRTMKATHLHPVENSLQELHLDNNPWHCNCDLLPFQLWLQRMGTKVVDFTYVTCATPVALLGKPLLQLTPEEFGC